MKKIFSFMLAAAVVLGLTSVSMAKMKGKDIKTMSKEEQMKLAQSSAPPSISNDATIMVFGADGKLMEAKKGSNGFTCLPDIGQQEVPEPMCADQASMQWADDLMKNAPKPTNTVPGIAYMARGGSHWEKEGKIIMKNEPGAKWVKEPPHWMVFWPFDSKTTGLPTLPNKFKTYIMWDGTPYSHLMIYQNPNKLK
ncbi:MAG: hypothetical protein HY880_07660 [Deltaproteobacteria bacterium]|nr:hypothetical protein [Deltaproteobacteria bacterium]